RLLADRDVFDRVLHPDADARHAEAARALLRLEARIAHELAPVVHAAVVETERVHETVAVEQVQRFVAFLRKNLLRGAVAIERAVDLARNLALDARDLVAVLTRRRAPSVHEPAPALFGRRVFSATNRRFRGAGSGGYCLCHFFFSFAPV